MYEENRFTTKQVYDQYGRSRTSNNKKDNISKSASLGGFEPDPVQRTSTTSYTYSQKDRKDKKDKKDKNKGSTYDEVPQVIKTGLGSRIDKPESQKLTGYQKVVEIFNDVMSGFGDFEEPTQPTFDTVKPQNVYKDKRYFAPNIYVPDTSQFGKGYGKKYFLGMELPAGSPKIPRSLKRGNVNIFGNTKDHPRLDMFGVKRGYTRNPDGLMSPSPMDQFIPPYQGEEFLDGALLKARQQQIKDDVEKVLQNLIDPPEDYVIKTGDTLSEIAEERGTTVEVLQELNNIEDKDTIFVGDKLKVPPKLTDTQAALRRGLGSKKDYGEGVEVALNMSQADMSNLSTDELIEMLRSFTNKMNGNEEVESTTAGSDFVEEAIDQILVNEGGYNNNASDKGNIVKEDGTVVGTMRGITPATYANHVGKNVNDVTAAEMRAVTEETAKEIYKNVYWTKPKISLLPKTLQENVFDMTVNSGRNAVKILQRLAGLEGEEVDGLIGPQTIRAVREAGITNNDYVDARITYYENLARNNSDQRQFLNGWINRAEEYRD